MVNEFVYLKEEVECVLLYVVVSGSLDKVGRVLVLASLEELLPVVEGYDLVAGTVDNKEWALYLPYAVDVWELVEWQCKAKIEDNSEGAHERRVKYNPGDWVLFG